MQRVQKRLQLEFLEPRVMLSAGDEPSGSQSFDQLSAAVRSDGLNISLELSALDRIVVLQGPGFGNVSIDLSQLPSSVVNLQISSFDSVTLIGDGTLDYLSLKEIGHVDAGRVSISNGLFAFGVERIQIGMAPSFVVLQGSADGLRDKTLLEVGAFSQGLIFSSLGNLGLSTGGRVDELNIISANSKQAIMLNFQPEHLNITGIDSSAQQVSVIKGDFTRYFLASPGERSSLEQSHLIARQTAVANVISLSTLLNKASVQAALSEVPENGIGAARIRSRFLADGEIGAARLALGSKLADPVSAIAATSVDTYPGAAEHHFEPLLPVGDGPSSSLPVWAKPTPPPDFAALDFLASVSRSAGASDGSGRADAAATDSPAALARLAEPFIQMVFDLRERFATFGDIATAQVASHLRTESRPVLLVDARTARQRSSLDFTVVNV